MCKEVLFFGLSRALERTTVLLAKFFCLKLNRWLLHWFLFGGCTALRDRPMQRELWILKHRDLFYFIWLNRRNFLYRLLLNVLQALWLSAFDWSHPTALRCMSQQRFLFDYIPRPWRLLILDVIIRKYSRLCALCFLNILISYRNFRRAAGSSFRGIRSSPKSARGHRSFLLCPWVSGLRLFLLNLS